MRRVINARNHDFVNADRQRDDRRFDFGGRTVDYFGTWMLTGASSQKQDAHGDRTPDCESNETHHFAPPRVSCGAGEQLFNQSGRSFEHKPLMKKTDGVS
jgi:hypothetical protein